MSAGHVSVLSLISYFKPAPPIYVLHASVIL